ncbi:MAG: hypothetical protein KGZ71_10270 [Desulfobulbaceae bacterium]|nr:hypothetical protein [Candidatus Kapabacteria bacterium]MBS4000853.1 hypothetical protein [Desulfobulbaceae bacterium]
MKNLLILFATIALIISCGEKEKEAETDPNAEMTNVDPHLGVMPDHTMMLDQLATGDPDFDPEDPSLKLSNLTFTAPSTWIREAPSSSMRVVQYALKADNSLKVTGFFFGEQDLAADNIERWKNEFNKLDNSSVIKMKDGKTDFVILEGTYNLKPFPMAQEFVPTPDYMVLAAIVPSSEGPYYFKVFGPKSILSKEIDTFKSFLNSVRVESM